MKVTAPGPDAGTPRETGPATVSQASARPAPSPLSLLHPELAAETAVLFVAAGLSPEDLDMFPGGDRAFKAQVKSAMRALRAEDGAR